MTNVFDVANYILTKTGKMSTFKLQKLCYYSQAWSLVWDDEELFPEEFEAWANGPVCRELFEVHRGQFSISASDLVAGRSIKSPTASQIETIDAVLDYYGEKDGQWLSTLTHLERPWKDARANVAIGMPSSEIISKTSMAEYYESI